MKAESCPIEVIDDRKKFQETRIPQIAGEFDLKKVVVEPNNIRYGGVVAIGPLDWSAKCGHHGVGIHGEAYFAYIPDKKIIGLSMSARILEYFANVTKEILQEEVNMQIVDFYYKTIKPKGVWLVMKAVHECMTARGVKQRNALTTTSDMRGVFHKDSALRDEVLKLWKL